MAPDAPADAQVAKKGPRGWEALTPALAEWVLDYINSMGYPKPTPVQASVLPLMMQHKDLVVEAVTGSGKTLGFLIPLVSRLLRADPPKRHHVGAIVVSPTRELAAQTHAVLVHMLAFHPASAALLPYLAPDADEKRPQTAEPAIVPQLLTGGAGTTPAQDLSYFLRQAPNVLVATPGRLAEILSSPHVHCSSSFELLVFDEADRLLDLGFKPDIARILSCLPKQRRTGLFSASVSEAVSEIIRVGLRNPVRVNVKVKSLKTGGVVEERRTPASLQMTYLVTPAKAKLPAITQLLEKLDPRPQKTILFCSTCAAVDYFQHVLPDLMPEGFAFIPLHGKHVQSVRQKNLHRFITSTQPSVLLTTDLAARGIDIPAVDLVVQLDPPSDPKVFIHRNGRAGRAGRKGLSVVLLHPGREEDYIQFLEIRKTPIAPLEHPTIAVSDADAAAFSDRIRACLRRDRALHDRAQRAFVSFVRAYSKHTASSIFRVADLDWASLGQGWGLLRLPKMPELKAFAGDRALGGEPVDWDAFAYADKARERQRQTALAAERAERAADPTRRADRDRADAERAKRKRNAEAWSHKHEREDVRGARREKRQKKTDAKRWDKMTDEERGRERELEGLLAEVRRKNEEKFAKEAAAAAAAEPGAKAGVGKPSAANDEFEGFD